MTHERPSRARGNRQQTAGHVAGSHVRSPSEGKTPEPGPLAGLPIVRHDVRSVSQSATSPVLHGVALAIALPILGGCQTGIGVGALNRCRQTLEARASSLQDSWVGWTRLDPARELKSSQQGRAQRRCTPRFAPARTSPQSSSRSKSPTCQSHRRVAMTTWRSS
jgi:hypothetical protein